MKPIIYDYNEISKLPKEWIDVKDALPPIGEEVIVFCPFKIEQERNPITALARFIPYEGSDEYYWDNCYPGKGNTHLAVGITKWQPMPDKPKD